MTHNHVASVWPPCCDVLQHVECCWLKFENGQILANNTQHVATRWPTFSSPEAALLLVSTKNHQSRIMNHSWC